MLLCVRRELLHKLFGIFLHGKFVSSAPFINFSNHCLYQYRLVDISFIQYYFIYFLTQFFPVLVTGSSFSGSQDPLTYPQHYVLVFAFSSTSLLPRTTRSSRIVLYIFCSSRRINHFSKESWFLLLENVIRDQDLGNKCNHCYQSILSRPSQLTEQKKKKKPRVFILIHGYMHIYKYFCMKLFVSKLS